jgi:hypothetical protein
MASYNWRNLKEYRDIDSTIFCEYSDILDHGTWLEYSKGKLTKAQEKKKEQLLRTSMECYHTEIKRGSEDLMIHLHLTDMNQKMDLIVVIKTAHVTMAGASQILNQIFNGDHVPK